MGAVNGFGIRGTPYKRLPLTPGIRQALKRTKRKNARAEAAREETMEPTTMVTLTCQRVREHTVEVAELPAGGSNERHCNEVDPYTDPKNGPYPCGGELLTAEEESDRQLDYDWRYRIP